MGIFKELKRYLKSEWYNIRYYHQIKLITLLLLILIIIFFPITIPLIIIGFILGMLIEIIPEKREYDKSLYKLITKKSYYAILFDRGYIAEYFTWRILNNQEEYKKVLINLYIPNEHYTSEIDSILINKHGIFVVESKGYSGWIFGNESQKKWTQVLYKNKNRFYNPIVQNRNHIKALANILGIEDVNIFRSYIIFSERCELKKITVNKPNVRVIKRNQLQNTLDKDYEEYGDVLLNSQIREFNNKLSDYMFANDDIKKEHIKYVEKIKNKETKFM